MKLGINYMKLGIKLYEIRYKIICELVWNFNKTYLT